MTQDQLADLAGIPQYHISAIETGRIADIKTDTLWRLAKALRVTTDSLLERDETSEHDDGVELSPVAEVLVPA
jgi:transcriptional regulator with XRE-family HTH domain